MRTEHPLELRLPVGIQHVVPHRGTHLLLKAVGVARRFAVRTQIRRVTAGIGHLVLAISDGGGARRDVRFIDDGLARLNNRRDRARSTGARRVGRARVVARVVPDVSVRQLPRSIERLHRRRQRTAVLLPRDRRCRYAGVRARRSTRVVLFGRGAPDRARVVRTRIFHMLRLENRNFARLEGPIVLLGISAGIRDRRAGLVRGGLLARIRRAAVVRRRVRIDGIRPFVLPYRRVFALFGPCRFRLRVDVPRRARKHPGRARRRVEGQRRRRQVRIRLARWKEIKHE